MRYLEAALRCLGLLTVATALSTVPPKSLMRSKRLQQNRETKLEVAAHGELVDTGMPMDPSVEVGANGELVDTGMRADPSGFQPCNVEYPLGKPDTSMCIEGHHDLITDPAMCEHAATMTNAHIDVSNNGVDHPFQLTEEWWDSHPRGCFAWKCAWDFEANTGSEKICYFFNPTGYDPCTQGKPCEGTPVCFAAKYHLGAHDANGGCPASYEVIDNEHTCRASASCQNLCPGEHFLIGQSGNQSQHDEYPEGCFQDDSDGCLYFNDPAANGWGTPQRPKGTPLCKASSAVGHIWTGEQATITGAAPTAAAEGEACEGFDESTGKPFPSCNKGLACQAATLLGMSIPGSGKKCVETVTESPPADTAAATEETKE